MSSAAKAEVGALFENAQEATVIRLMLEEMGHPQPTTPLETDNTTAHGIINGTVKQQRSWAMDRRFYWIQDRVHQKQFMLVWGPGESNMGDYQTKHHPATHHPKVRPLYVHTPESPTYIPRSAERTYRGWVGTRDHDPSSAPVPVPPRASHSFHAGLATSGIPKPSQPGSSSIATLIN